jgi:predicted CopG family antitoxin
MGMGTKTLSISDDAYRRLRAAKVGNESFSQVIQRLTGRRDLAGYFGSIGKAFGDDLEAASREVRATIDAEVDERRRRLGMP